MTRVALRGAIIVLALAIVFATAETALCEMICAASDRATSVATITDSARGAAASHCDGEQNDSAPNHVPMPGGNSNRNTKHNAAHSHVRIVATVVAKLQASPTLTLSEFGIYPVNFGATTFARGEENSWNNNSSPPMKSNSTFSAGVLRI